MITWSDKLKMLFNFENCECLHAKYGHTGVNYEMVGTITILCKTVNEQDLRVTINVKIEVSEQCRIAASRDKPIF